MRTLILLVLSAIPALSQTIYDTNHPVVQTFAGSSFAGLVNGNGQQTMFDSPQKIVSDSNSNLFVWDVNNSVIRKITPCADVTTFAGGGAVSPPASGTNAGFFLHSLSIDPGNVMWGTGDDLQGTHGDLIRIGTDAFVSSASGGALSGNTYGSSPTCIDSQGNIYFVKTNCVLRRLASSGNIEVFAGSGNDGDADGSGLFCSFHDPRLLCFDTADTLYLVNYTHLKRVSQSRTVEAIAGNGDTIPRDGQGFDASIYYGFTAAGCYHAGNIYLAYSWSIRRVELSTTNVTTVAGLFSESGYTNGPGSIARFGVTYGICCSGNRLFVADANNERIRVIDFDPPEQAVTPSSLTLKIYPGLDISGMVGRTYRIESSLNLTNWSAESTFLLPSNPYRWFDQNSVEQTKYYRAVLLP